jgi:hypothetical protein
MRAQTSRAALAVLGAALLLTPTTTLLAAKDEVLWLDASQQVPAFVPESLLVGDALLSAPLATIDRERLAAWKVLSTRDEAQDTTSSCAPARRVPPMGSAADATSLVGVLGRSPQVVLVTINAIESGYSPWFGTVARRISVSVEALVRGRGIALAEELSFVAPGGAARIGTAEVCALTAGGFAVPEIGSRWLLAGARAPEVHQLFGVGVSFPVIDGQVQLQPYPGLDESAKAETVEALTRTLASSEVKP